MLADEELLLKIGARDQEAFAEFYDRHAPRVLGMLTRLTGRRADADDALQEVFWQVWQKAGQFDSERGNGIVWLVHIARSRGIDVIRRRRVAPTSLVDWQDRATEQKDTRLRHAEPAQPDERLAGSADAKYAVAALSRLPRPEHEAIVLSFYGGMTHEQIAQDTNTPLGTVKSRIRRGMQKLKTSLNGQLDELP